jgi:hypothetical protein
LFFAWVNDNKESTDKDSSGNVWLRRADLGPGWPRLKPEFDSGQQQVEL